MVVTPTLQKQHAAIMALCDELLEALDELKSNEAQDNLNHIMPLINTFVAKSLHHLAAEDNHTYIVALASPDERVSIRAYELKRDFGNLRSKIVSFRERFLTSRMPSAPDLFIQEAAMLIKMSKKRIIREEKELFPLFLKEPPFKDSSSEQMLSGKQR